MSIHNRRQALFLVGLMSLTVGQQVRAGNALELTAEIENAGECDITVSPSLVEFKRRAAVVEFVVSDAVDAKPLSLIYKCKGYETNARPEIKITGNTAMDTKLFLTPDPQGAKGVGFMLKEGSISDLSGYYSAGQTVMNGDSVFLPSGVDEGEQLFTVGFIRQMGNNTVTAGSVNASILFTVVMP